MNRWVAVVAWVMGALVVVYIGWWVVWYLQPIAGDITDKKFYPAHMEWRSNQSCSTNTTTTTVGGKTVTKTNRTCINIPYQAYVPDYWQITVCDEERCKGIEVSQVKWEDLQVGQYFSEKN